MQVISIILIRDQYRRSQPRSVRSHPRHPTLTLLFPLFYHSGYVPDLIMLTRTVLRSTRLARQRRSPLGRQSIVAIPNYSLLRSKSNYDSLLAPLNLICFQCYFGCSIVAGAPNCRRYGCYHSCDWVYCMVLPPLWTHTICYDTSGRRVGYIQTLPPEDIRLRAITADYMPPNTLGCTRNGQKRLTTKRQ